MSPESKMRRLLELLHVKYKKLSEMMVHTDGQTQAINEDNVDMLQELVDKKQVIIDYIDKLDSEFNEKFVQLKQQLGIKNMEELDTASVKGAADLKSSVKRIIDLVKKISAAEHENQNKAKRLINALSGNIKKISNGKKLNSAYIPKPHELPSYFMDKKK